VGGAPAACGLGLPPGRSALALGWPQPAALSGLSFGVASSAVDRAGPALGAVHRL